MIHVSPRRHGSVLAAIASSSLLFRLKISIYIFTDFVFFHTTSLIYLFTDGYAVGSLHHNTGMTRLPPGHSTPAVHPSGVTTQRQKPPNINLTLISARDPFNEVQGHSQVHGHGVQGHHIQSHQVQGHGALGHQSQSSEEQGHRVQGHVEDYKTQSFHNQRRKSSTENRSPIAPIMSYHCSADLEDPKPMYNAYNPEDGIAWAPRRTHHHKDPVRESFRKFRSLGSIQSLRSTKSRTTMCHSATSLNSASSVWRRTNSRQNVLDQGTPRQRRYSQGQNHKREHLYSYRQFNDSVDGLIDIDRIEQKSHSDKSNRPRCYTDGSRTPKSPRTPRSPRRSRSRSHFRTFSRESLPRLEKSWASFDEYNWDQSVMILNEDNLDFDTTDDVFLGDESPSDPEIMDCSHDLNFSCSSDPSVDMCYVEEVEETMDEQRLRMLLGVNDLQYLFIPRGNLRTGRLLMRGNGYSLLSRSTCKPLTSMVRSHKKGKFGLSSEVSHCYIDHINNFHQSNQSEGFIVHCTYVYL